MGSPTIFKGNNVKFLKENMEFRDVLIKNGTFNAANNQTTPADVTGLNFANADTRAAKIIISIDIQATQDLFAQVELEIVQKGSSWELSQSFTGDETNIIFSITAAGQIQYVSGNEAGFTSSTIKYSAPSLNA
jgi:hypothetical protein